MSAMGDARAKAGKKGKKTEGRGPPLADLLATIGLGFNLWHDPAHVAFASIGQQCYKVQSKPFRLLLVNEFRKRHGNKVPNAESVAAAVNAIEGAAVFDGPEHVAHVRIAGHGGDVYLHLADADSTVIRIGADGWAPCGRPPVQFRKPAGMLSLPMPEAGGNLSDLREFLNLPDDSAYVLVVAWLMGVFNPDGPFPLLTLLGEQGSAKSTTARVLKRLIDPSSAPVGCEPREVRDLMIKASNNWMLAYDNLSTMPGWFSDALCRLATGGGFTTRELYTDDGEIIFDAKRPMILNGIEDFISRGDLLERAILLRHPPIPEGRRKAEREFWERFEAARPRLLGAVLDRVAGGLRELPNVDVHLPRMADFAKFAVACENGVGETGFLSAYAENQAGSHEQALDASPIPAVLVTFMDNRDWWEGTATELLKELTALVPEKEKPKDWPAKPNVLTNKLRRLASDLRRVHQLDVRDRRMPGGKRTRVITIQRLSVDEGDSSSPPSRPSPPLAQPPKPRSSGSDDGGTQTPCGRAKSRDDRDGRDVLFPNRTETDLSALFR